MRLTTVAVFLGLLATAAASVVHGDMHDDMQKDVHEDMLGEMMEDMHSEMEKDMPEDMSGEMEKDMPEVMSGEMEKDMPEVMSGEMEKDMPEDMPGEMEKDMAEDMSGEMEKDMPEDMHGEMEKDMPEAMNGEMEKDMPEEIHGDMEKDMPEDMNGEMEKDMAEDMHGEMEKDMAEDMHGEMEKDMPGEMSGEMEKDMPEEMHTNMHEEVEEEMHEEKHSEKHASHWAYLGKHGFSNWAKEYKTCGGQHQSPIDVNPFFSLVGSFEPFYFSHYHEVPSEATIINNGHALEVKMTGENQPEMSGANLGSPYTFVQYHVHWGVDDLRGSEHTINHVRFPMEMHLVHYKTEYGSLGAALNHSDGAAVLSILFVISANDNPSLAPLISQLKTNKEVGEHRITTDLYPLTSVLPRDLSRFYRYRGSLTTPTCNEAVTWTIFDDHVPVSEKQMNSIRTLHDINKDPLVNNFRPTQPLNGRKVYRSFKK